MVAVEVGVAGLGFLIPNKAITEETMACHRGQRHGSSDSMCVEEARRYAKLEEATPPVIAIDPDTHDRRILVGGSNDFTSEREEEEVNRARLVCAFSLSRG